MKFQSPHPDRDYWIATSLFAFCTFMFIMVNQGPVDRGPELKFWLSYLESSRPDRRELAASHLRQESRAVMPRLLRMMESHDTNTQAQAVLAFAAMNGHARPAIPELARLLRRDTTSLAAARALAAIGRSSLPALTNALYSPVRFVRSNAARGIGLLHADARPAVPLLVNVLADRDETLRWAASRALGHIAAKPDQAVPALVSRLEDQSLEVRKMAIVSLGKFRGDAKAAVPALRHKVLWGVSQDIRNAAVFALKEVDPAAPAMPDMN